MVYEYGVENKKMVQSFLSSLVPQEEIDILRRVKKVYSLNQKMGPRATLDRLSRIEENAMDYREVRFPAEGRWHSLSPTFMKKIINDLHGVLKLWSDKWDDGTSVNLTNVEQNAFVTAFEESMSKCFSNWFNREEFENEFYLKWIPSESSLVPSENIENRDNPTSVNLSEEMLSQISGRVDKLCGEITATNERFDEDLRKTNEGLVSAEKRFDEFVGLTNKDIVSAEKRIDEIIRKSNEDFALAEKRFDYLKTTLDDLPQMSWKKRIRVDRW